ncbi:hypothetical protein FACS189479_05170 [Spirochaetia bacterium]|nr:hypothetical protein FACS189479_05170 [Spirochaetia bacterium]
MFRKNALLRNAFSLFAVFALVMGALSFVGCNDDSGFVDDHKLNSGLIDDWKYTFAEGYDQYMIDATKLVYTFNYGGVTTSFTGSIEYIYNFSETAGVIIVQYTAYNLGYGATVGQYQGVYFRDLTALTVKLGSAYASDYSVVEVADLAAAKEKFKSFRLYGGELSAATPLTRQ